MKTLPAFPTRTDYLRRRVRQLVLNKPLRITKHDITPREQKAWYHAASVEGMKVSIKTAHDGVWVWRVK